MRKAPALAAVLVSILLAGCVGSSSPAMPIFDPALLPTVPTAAQVEGADPQARATSLAAATDDSLASTDAGWIATYSEFGIPVIDSRVPSSAADPVGPRWSEVWAIGGLSRGTATIPLTDAVGILAEASVRNVDAASVLSALQQDATGADPRLATLALFVAAKSVSNSGADPLDPATTADSVKLDAATIQLLAWEFLRHALVDAAGSISGAPTISTQSVLAGFMEDGAGGAPCSGPRGAAEQASWANWAATNGGDPAGEGPSGETVSQFLEAADAIASLLALIAEVNALDVAATSEPEVLVREKKAIDGEEAQLDFRLEFNASLLDANDQALCALATAANALGVGLALPADGTAISGAELNLNPIENFPDKINFQDRLGENSDLIVTDSAGMATTYTQGQARGADLPETAKPKDDEYGFAISARVDDAATNSILDLFVAGLSSAGSGTNGGALDTAKLFRFDLGDEYFPFTDWQSGYRVDQIWLEGYRVTGVVCDIDLPFVLQLDGAAIPAFSGPLMFLQGDGQFSYSFQGMFGGYAPGIGNGYGYTKETDSSVELFLDGGNFLATFPPPVGTVPVGPGGQHFIGALADPIILKADPTACQGR